MFERFRISRSVLECRFGQTGSVPLPLFCAPNMTGTFSPTHRQLLIQFSPSLEDFLLGARDFQLLSSLGLEFVPSHFNSPSWPLTNGNHNLKELPPPSLA